MAFFRRTSIDQIADSLRRAAEKGHVSTDAVEETLRNIFPQTSLECAGDCTTIIVVVKEEVVQQLEQRIPETTLLCTNASKLSITSLAARLQHKTCFSGTRFFDPVPRKKFVEVIAGAETDPAAVTVARSLVVRWGKTAVMAPDSPDFIVNRIFDVIKQEALHLNEEEFGARDVDQAVRLGLNFPTVLFELMDLIGLDTTYDGLINQVSADEPRTGFWDSNAQTGGWGKNWAQSTKWGFRLRASPPEIFGILLTIQ